MAETEREMEQRSTGRQEQGREPEHGPSNPLVETHERKAEAGANHGANHGTNHGGYLRIFTFAGRTEYIILGISILAAIASGAGIALQNLIFGSFVTTLTDFTSGKSTGADLRRESANLALYFVYLGIARFLLSYTYNSLLTYNAYRIVRNIRLAYLRAALSQEVAYFDSGVGGSIATQATSNGRMIQGGISEKLGLTFQGLSAFITAFIVAFITNWKLTLIISCIAPATIVVMAVTSVIEAGLETRILEIYSQANSFAEGVLASARTVHAFEMRSRLVKKFDGYLSEAHHVGNKISPLFGILFSLEYCIIYLGFGLAFWQGIHMLSRGEIETSGDVFTVLLSVAIAAISLTSLAPYSIEFTRAASSAAQLFTLIDRRSAIDPFDSSGARPPAVAGHFELDHVDFAYPARMGVKVLDDFALEIPAGKVTALVGQSGSGKSTIVGLIERWYDPISGSIKLDGHRIGDLNINWLRRNVRLVQQEPVLFQGSIFDNIAFGLVGTEWQDAPKEMQLTKVQDASKIAFAHDFISELPNGYDTQIGQRGSLLSGGQKQRIAIARSIISEPVVLLLDEATSALDPRAEGIVQQALDRASKGRTTVVIAHKLATIRKADKIVVMKEGKILEQGTHESLIASEGAYAKMVKIQDLTFKASQTDSDSENADVIEADEDLAEDLTKPMSQTATQDQTRVELCQDHDNYDKHRQLGFFAVIFQLIRGFPTLRLAYLLILIGCIGASAAFPGQALLIAYVSEVFTLPGPEMIDRGNFFAAMFIILAVGCMASYFILGYTTNTVAQTISHAYRKQSFNDMLQQDLQFFDRQENNSGALASRVDSNPQAILELMGFNVGLVITAALNIMTCSILGIAFSWKLGLVVVLAGLPPFVSSGWLKIRFDAKLDRSISRKNSSSAAIASEAVAAIRTVSSLTIEQSLLDKYSTELDDGVDGSIQPLFRLMVWFAFAQSIEYWFMALGFWYGCRLVSMGEISMFDFFVTFMGVFLSGQATSQLSQYSTSITKGINAANYIFWLHELQPTIRQTNDNADRGPKSGGPIVLDHVRFSYPFRPEAQVLRGIDFKIERGQFVAFVGASGCGKSTMIAMLERFYDPSSGSIRIDGDNLTRLNPRLYRRVISLVQQEPTLFQGTIRENIALGMDDAATSAAGIASQPSPALLETSTATDTEIEEALRAANAWEFVSSLPDGLHTAAGTSGTQLSGGQRQRIAIARSLIRKPKVLLLDEATSALDTESEKIVQSTLAEAAQEEGRITIAVAHRLSTIKDANAICVFHGGKIVELGTHSELIVRGGMYKKMCEAQSLEG